MKPLLAILTWVVTLSLSCWSQQHFKVAVVLVVHGQAERIPAERKVPQPIRVLESLREGDTLLLDPGESVQLLWLNDHVRYEVRGPLREQLGLRRLPPPSPFRQSSQQPQRAALRASQELDLNRYGGGSTRDIGLAWQVLDQGQVALVLPPDAGLEVDCRDGNQRVPVDPHTLVLDLTLQPGESRDLRLRTSTGERSIRVSRLDAADSRRLSYLKRTPLDSSDWVERIFTSLELRLVYQAYLDYLSFRQHDPETARELGTTFQALLQEAGGLR